MHHTCGEVCKMIIGICGLIGSGKGTVADILVAQHGFTKMSFADSLKDAVAAVFGWPRHLLEGDTELSRQWREQVDHWWAERLQLPDLTPRWILQNWGTEVCRRGFHDDIWIASLQRRITQQHCHRIVVPDLRFPNEIDMIQQMQGAVWMIQRGSLPQWFIDYRDRSILPSDEHLSEFMWASSTVDHCILNDGTVDQLARQIFDIISAVNTP